MEKKEYTFYDLRIVDKSEAPALNVPGLRFDKLFVPRDGGKYMLFQAEIDKKQLTDTVCPVCGSHNTNFDGSGDARVVRDVSRANYRVDIIFFPVRMRCKDCGARFNPSIPGIADGKQRTKRLDDFLRTECFIQPFTTLCERTGLSLPTISDILEEEAQKLDDKRKRNPVPAPHVLGIDEKHINYDMRGTLVDIENGQLINILEDNKTPTMQDAIKALKNWDTDIKVVTTDMNNSYLSWLPKLLPTATVVVDKFHVVQDVQQAVTRCRRALMRYRKALIAKETDPEEKERLNAIYNISAKHQRLFNLSTARVIESKEADYADMLATVTDAFPEFKMLHNFRCGIESMYMSSSYEEAENIFNLWIDVLPPHNQKEYEEWCALYDYPINLFEEWRSFTSASFLRFKPFILNYFKSGCRYTNAATEGLNRLIDQVNTEGNGYSFKTLRAKCLYASLVNEHVIYNIKVSDVKQKIAKSQTYFSPGFVSSYSSFTSHTSTYTPEPRKTKPKMQFVERRISVSIPTATVLGDNNWLTFVLNADAVKQKRDDLSKIEKARKIDYEKRGKYSQYREILLPDMEPVVDVEFKTE